MKVYLIKFVTVGERWQPWWDARKMNVPDDIIFLRIDGAHVFLLTTNKDYTEMFKNYSPETIIEMKDVKDLLETINRYFTKLYYRITNKKILIAASTPGRIIGTRGRTIKLLKKIITGNLIVGGIICISHDLVGNAEINISDRKILQKYNLKEEQWYHTEIKFSDLPKVQHEECKRNGKTSKIIPWYDIPEWVKNLLKQL
ncbi:MAG: hypothetical protein DRI61_08970 [Chloroflexi bacterium]|nr:MAG: hypothetical protein DRI61_08970 [Chloroflexota bacterium]